MVDETADDAAASSGETAAGEISPAHAEQPSQDAPTLNPDLFVPVTSPLFTEAGPPPKIEDVREERIQTLLERLQGATERLERSTEALDRARRRG